MTQTIERPDRTESADYYFTYIDKVPAGDIRKILETQAGETSAMLRSISDDASLGRYAPDKWSIREVVSHINDAERVFAFARSGLPGATTLRSQVSIRTLLSKTANADQRAWHEHVDEFDSIRAATVALFSSLPDEAWSRRGVASGNPFSVRALAFVTAGHVAHHIRILRERYRLSAPS